MLLGAEGPNCKHVEGSVFITDNSLVLFPSMSGKVFCNVLWTSCVYADFNSAATGLLAKNHGNIDTQPFHSA